MKTFIINTEETYKNEDGEYAIMTGSHEVSAKDEKEALFNVKKILFPKERVQSISEKIEKKKV
jgi:hypothetical protein